MSIFQTIKETVHDAQLQARKFVSGDKYRFVTEKYDLDLTYITENIIAMGFPAMGPEASFRNDASEVVEMLRLFHNNKFLIINVSEKSYNYPFLNPEEVVFLGWQDHYPPPLDILIKVVEEMDRFLSKDPENVVALHCMAGRSRTGVSIASYFLYKNICPTPQDAIQFFNSRRAAGPSLALPSQIRTVYNYFTLLSGRPGGVGPIGTSLLDEPKMLLLKKIIFTPVPLTGFQATGCKPVVELYGREGFVLPSGARPHWVYISHRKYRPQDTAICVSVDTIISGEVLIKFFHLSMDSLTSVGHRSLVFRIHFHTSFVQQLFVDFSLKQLDAPESDLSMIMSPNKILDPNFRVRLLLDEVLDVNQQQLHQEQRRLAVEEGHRSSVVVEDGILSEGGEEATATATVTVTKTTVTTADDGEGEGGAAVGVMAAVVGGELQENGQTGQMREDEAPPPKRSEEEEIIKKMLSTTCSE